MDKRTKPIWIQPENDTQLPNIKIFNSLTNQKDLFKPNKGNHIEWYSCGPTVYDSSHMGHARAYISIDIIRRVFQNYFNFDVHYVMNITDIDDKIIKRARQTYLFGKYIEEKHSQSEYIEVINSSLNHLESKLNKETDEDKKIMFSKEIVSIKEVLKIQGDINQETVLKIKDPISDVLDKEKGNTVADNSIFEDLPRFYENDFMEDMKNLNVLPPNDLTRVSEYIEKIIIYVQEIIVKEFAYEKCGSVYFDTDKFDNCEKHYYAKLVPNAFGNEVLLREGEGALTNFEAGEKKSENDFALWKCSKPGEPSWDSPWGKGRPGWHIECSVMAGDKCGDKLDIHTGGVDLKFPHHDNELAQSEAHFSCYQWVNYFLHTGHLTIAGCKMSKSLKNFITIKEALKSYSSRQLRFMFLLHSWKDTLDYSKDTMTAALNYEKMILDFFFNVENVCKTQKRINSKPTVDLELKEKLVQTKQRIFDALCDSVDTRESMNALRDLITLGNNHYMKFGTKNSNESQLKEIAIYVYEIVYMFGAADKCDEFGLIYYTKEELGKIMTQSIYVAKQFVTSIRESIDENSENLIDDLIGQFVNQCRATLFIDLEASNIATVETCSHESLDNFLDLLASFRQAIRAAAIKNKWYPYLSKCDSVRDIGLVSIGIRLQDIEDSSAIGLMPAWAQDKKPAAKAPQAVKPTATKKKLDASVDPKIMFTIGIHEGQYSLFDDEGVPTHDSKGDEISKTKKGKLKKLMSEQQKSYEKFSSKN